MRPLTKATRGVLKGGSSKKALVMAMAGVMFFSPDVIVSSPMAYTQTEEEVGGRRQTELEKKLLREKKIIEEEEEQWLVFMAAFLKTL